MANGGGQWVSVGHLLRAGAVGRPVINALGSSARERAGCLARRVGGLSTSLPDAYRFRPGTRRAGRGCPGQPASIFEPVAGHRCDQEGKPAPAQALGMSLPMRKDRPREGMEGRDAGGHGRCSRADSGGTVRASDAIERIAAVHGAANVRVCGSVARGMRGPTVMGSAGGQRPTSDAGPAWRGQRCLGVLIRTSARRQRRQLSRRCSGR